MKHLTILIGFFLFIFTQCSQKDQKAHELKLPYIVDIDNLSESIDLKLSDLADSFELIQLETTDECLLDDHTKFYVYEKYILAYGKEGVYKFSREGKFIKKLFVAGRGPDEFFGLVGLCRFIVDEENDKLYIYDQIHRSEYFVYDLNSEIFVSRVKKNISGYGGFYLFKDTTIVSSVFQRSDTSYYAVYYQDLKGNLLSAISHTKVLTQDKNEVPDAGMLYKSDTNYFFNFVHTDTLYTIRGDELIPFIALKFQIPKKYPATTTKHVGDRFIRYEIRNNKFIIIKISTLVKQIWYSQEAGDELHRNAYFYFDMTSGKASGIKTFTDDLINKVQDARASGLKDDWYMELPSVQENGLIVTPYQPLEILEAVKKGLSPVACYSNINARLKDLSISIKETDNPVLLIGK